MTAQTAAEVRALVDRHGWADAIARIVDDAPPVPDAAVDLLIASGFPTGKNHGSDKREAS